MILIAGVGNIFFGDDAFGSELARRLQARTWPDDVRVEDFGIRGFDLMYGLMDGYEAAVLLDAAPRGGQSGTLYLIEPDLAALEIGPEIETHGMDPLRVLAAARQMGAAPERVYVLGCEPGILDGMGMSEPVSRAVDEAVIMVEGLIGRIRTEREAYEPGKAH
jgi:hydrogenase maturation protease